jgi:hypothetical protein
MPRSHSETGPSLKKGHRISSALSKSEPFRQDIDQVVCLQMLGADSTSWPVSSPIGGQNHLNAAHCGIQSIGSIVAWRSPRAAAIAALRPHDSGADQNPGGLGSQLWKTA